MNTSTRAISILSLVFGLLACGDGIERQEADGGAQNPTQNTEFDEGGEFQTGLHPRLQLKDSPLSLKAKGIESRLFSVQSLDRSSGLSFHYLASASPPLDPNSQKPLQATNFAFANSLVIVSYMMAGPERIGAIDLVELGEKNWANIRSSLIFEDAEFADLKVKDDFVFAVGADAEGAVLVVIDISNTKEPSEVSRVSLPGHFATSIELDDDRIFVSSGDNAGVLELSIKSPKDPQLIQFDPLINSLSIQSFHSNILGMGGENFTGIFRLDSKGPSWMLKLGSESEAPARFAISNHLLLTNAVDGKLIISKVSKELDSAKILHEVELSGTGNAIDMAHRYAFLAQGEEGLQVWDVKEAFKPSFLGGLHFPNESASTNQVRYGVLNDRPYIFLADGRGGFRVISFEMKWSMTASKAYNPSRFYDDLVLVNAPSVFKIPESLPVTHGNAGNHKAFLQFDDILCVYQGGSAQAKPNPKNPAQWGRGLEYKFRECSNGMMAGDPIEAREEIWLQVNHGHNEFSPTTIQFELEFLQYSDN